MFHFTDDRDGCSLPQIICFAAQQSRGTSFSLGVASVLSFVKKYMPLNNKGFILCQNTHNSCVIEVRVIARVNFYSRFLRVICV